MNFGQCQRLARLLRNKTEGLSRMNHSTRARALMEAASMIQPASVKHSKQRSYARPDFRETELTTSAHARAYRLIAFDSPEIYSPRDFI